METDKKHFILTYERMSDYLKTNVIHFPKISGIARACVDGIRIWMLNIGPNIHDIITRMTGFSSPLVILCAFMDYSTCGKFQTC